jgi:hypothetical protein
MLAACSSPAPAAPTSPPLVAPTAQATPAPVIVQAAAPQPAPQPAVRPIASPSPASLPLSLLAGRSGADLRTSLDVLLEEQAFLMAIGMQSAGNARLDEQIGISNLLDDNATTLAGIVGAVTGQTAAQAFLDAWRGQTLDLLSYAQGQKSPALTDLDSRRAAIAAQLATGEFSAATADAALQRRLQAQLALADSFVEHDQSRAAEQLAELLEAGDDLGRPLASAMAARMPDLLPATTEGGDVDVRLHLTSAYTSHLLLSAAAVESAADARSADAQTYSTAAAGAAEEVGHELNLMFTSDTSGPVADRLNAQTAAYISAASGGDRHQAAADIDRIRGELDALLSSANPLLAPGLLNQQLRASDQPLLTAADAFAARDYASAFARIHEAVRQAQKPTATLALAIVDRYPARFLDLPTPGPGSSVRAPRDQHLRRP